MRRSLAVVLSVLVTLVMLAPSAFAQAPAPASKVTINGLIDNIGSWSKNMSLVDLDLKKTQDREYYMRTRVRPDITGEVGTTKFVLGLEIDYVWGQTGDQGKVGNLGGTANLKGTNGTGFAGTQGSGGQHAGATCSAAINTDTEACIEIKWAYTEFDLPGLPMPTRFRLGAQPFAVTYKPGVLATGDFAGVNVDMTLTPDVKGHLTYAQIEDSLTGAKDGFIRGEDFAVIGNVEITPFKGLDIRPIYAYMKADGVTSGSSRQGRGGIGNAAATFPLGAIEERHTVGFDTQFRSGPFSLTPTVFYQFGQRQIVGLGYSTVRDQDRKAWLIDVRGGFQTGPLLLEAAAIYTSGNKANQDIRRPKTDIKFYEPIDVDSNYYITWAEHFALGLDYFYNMRTGAAGLGFTNSIGYDKYGLKRLGTRASYTITPSFLVRTAITANWTAEEVDTRGNIAAATGITPCDTVSAAQASASGRTCSKLKGTESYLGTEIDLGFQWRFAPNVALDVGGAHTFAGPALGAATATNASTGFAANDRKVKDIDSLTWRVRYTF